jgi:lipopolysaccharide transport system ATP-binding protein
VADGESVGILGVNGAGKSTLLKVITGTTQPTTGSVKIHGRVAALLELGMGFHPDFTGRQNVFMAAQLQGLTTAQIESHLIEIREFADIGDYFEMPVRVYSSGMQVRLAFAVATAIRPDVLIVDEALSVGDVAFQAKCFRRIREYKEQGTTLLLVTHSLDDVVKHCQKAIVLDGGYIVDEGEPRVVVNKFRDRLFGRTRKAIANNENLDSNETGRDDSDSDERVSEPAVPVINFDLSDSDVFSTRALYQNIEHRWGGGGARITDYALRANDRLYPTSVEVGEQLTIAFRVWFDRALTAPVFGLMIKTLEGQIVYGTNSELKGKEINEVAAGEAVNCQFSFPAKLNAGHYLISLGVSEASLDGQDLPLDRRYDAILLVVTAAESFLGLFDFSASCTLEQ